MQENKKFSFQKNFNKLKNLNVSGDNSYMPPPSESNCKILRNNTFKSA